MRQSSRECAPTVLLVGIGDLSVRVAHLLSQQAEEVNIVMAGRSLDRAIRYANLTKFAAANLGCLRQVDGIEMDLQDEARTAETIAAIQPDIIFLGASMQAARAIVDLPAQAFRELDDAQLGPWIPMHLTLAYELMRAVTLARSQAKVVNACYPDAVGPALKSVGLAPFVGIGNVGNVIPAIRFAAAHQLGAAVEDVDVRLIAHHFFSHHVHRFGEAAGIPYLLDVSVAGRSEPLDDERLFGSLAQSLRRQGGRDGQQLTAASAITVIRAALGLSDGIVHAPAPEGMTGGFPVRFDRGSLALCVPPGISPAKAEEINQACQRLDGIAEISSSGIIRFEAEQMSVLTKMLGYECSEMKVGDTRAHAEELSTRYAEYLAGNGFY